MRRRRDKENREYKVYAMKKVAELIGKNEPFDNLSLALYKFPLFIKKYDLRETLGRFGEALRRVKEEYQKFYDLQNELWSKIGAETLTLKTNSRVVVGLGDESVYEVSIRLYRNYGVPYIPGSAIKGCLKHYAVYALADKNRKKLEELGKDLFEIAEKIQKALEETDESKIDQRIRELELQLGNRTLSFSELREIFGTQEAEGKVVFFDALPHPEDLEHRILELDVMNPHYQPYYGSDDPQKNPPGDWFDPIPILFLTVRKDVRFDFAIWVREGKDKELGEKVRILLEKALKEFGIGAKTTLGYGRFSSSETTSN